MSSDEIKTTEEGPQREEEPRQAATTAAVKKPAARIPSDSRFLGVIGCGDDFRAVYWPMEKWIDDHSTIELLSAMMDVYPALDWDNPLSAQFNAMMSVMQDSEWVEELRSDYDLSMVDFMRVIFLNWPELFTKKRYASALSATIMSCLIK